MLRALIYFRPSMKNLLLHVILMLKLIRIWKNCAPHTILRIRYMYPIVRENPKIKQVLIKF